MNKEIKHVAILGSGMLGAQIAMLVRHRGYGVTLYDPQPGTFGATVEKYRKDFKSKGNTPFIPLEDWDAIEQSCREMDSLEAAVETADLIIEAVPEILDLKKEIFEKMGKAAPAHAILASNSSSIPVSRMEQSSGHPERCVNIHFYQILSGMNMTDVMPGTSTLPEVVEACADWVRSIGCVPLKVNRELLGFCFNRVWRAVKKETLQMWANGFVDFRDVDRAWMIFTGMNMGPFGLMDLVGLDTVYNIERVYYENSGDPGDHPPKELMRKIEKGELGVKTARGFYKYPKPEFVGEAFLSPEKPAHDHLDDYIA